MRRVARRIVGLLTLGICLTGCGADNAGDSSELPSPDTSVTDTTASASPTSEPMLAMETTIVDVSLDGCAPTPRVELTSGADVVAADVVFYGESSPTCGFNADGDAMFDDSFRPERAILATDGRLEIAVDQPGSVTVDTRLLQPDTGLAAIDPGGQALSASDGAYSLELPGSGCFVVTIGFKTETRSGRFTALAASSSDAC